MAGEIWGQGNRTAFQVCNGAFVKIGEITGAGAAEKFDDSCTRGVGFLASRISSVYGSSQTVTPTSESCLFVIRY